MVRRKEEEEEINGFLCKLKGIIQDDEDIWEKRKETKGFVKPKAAVFATHILKINLKQCDIMVDVLVLNPNPDPIPLININYLIGSDGREIVQVSTGLPRFKNDKVTEMLTNLNCYKG